MKLNPEYPKGMNYIEWLSDAIITMDKHERVERLKHLFDMGMIKIIQTFKQREGIE